MLCGPLLKAQNSEVIKNYITTYKDIAISEMQRTGVPAAITLAQGIHETEAGRSELVRKSNNHFGIKCKTEWKGESVTHDDDARGECFRKYNDPLDSYRDHSDFLKNRSPYAFLFKLDPTDYEAWAYGLKKAGYATNPKYPQILIKLIRDYNLQDYTLIAMGQKAPDQPVLVSTKTTDQPAVTPSAPIETTAAEEATTYPNGVFKINSTKVIFVPKGTSFLKVAEEHDLSLNRLFEFNDMAAADIAVAGQLMFLQRKRKTGSTEYHEVLPGETVYSIAQKEGIRMESLLELNGIKETDQPLAGEKLNLQNKAAAPPRLSSNRERITSARSVSEATSREQPETESFLLHVVQPKETVYAISKKYAVSVEEVLKWNDLVSADLKSGQQLRIFKRTMNGTN
jgi:LysM repeat protein